MTKLNRWLLTLLALQIVALVVVWLIPSGTPAERPRKVLEGKIDPLAASRIVVVGNDGKKIDVKKRDGGWVLASGGDYPVQATKVGELLGKLPGLVGGSPVTSKASHHAALEVAADSFQREVTVEQTGKAPLVRPRQARRALETALMIDEASERTSQVRGRGDLVAYLAAN